MSIESAKEDINKPEETSPLQSTAKKHSSKLRIHSDSSNDELIDNFNSGTSIPIRDIHSLAKYSDQDISEYDMHLKDSNSTHPIHKI